MAWLKKITALSIISLVFLSSSAQSIGIQTGVEFNKIAPFLGDDDFAADWRAGFGLGLIYMSRFEYRSRFITGLLYSDSRNAIIDMGSPDMYTFDLRNQSIRLPLMYGFNIIREPVDVSIFLGLNLGYGFRFESSWVKDYQNREIYLFYEEDYYKIFAGAATGILAYYRNFTLKLQYSYDIVAGVSIEDNWPFTIKMISVYAGYSFKLGKSGTR